uniref:G_PROTEIN_RECEP_F1_2 domain-containing protein n=1 Tax=Syphacia muris TaxID=451379 RepID=A0A0N5A7R9_9BILA
MRHTLCELMTSGQQLTIDGTSTLTDPSTHLLSYNGTMRLERVSLVNQIVYAYIAPVVITSGIIGDVLTIATLSHPMFKRSSIVYVYLTLLAITDLMMHCSIIPMVLNFLNYRLCSYSSAIYYAHVGFPLVNALMGSSVWIVVFLTMSQYVAVCYPLYGDFLRSRRLCFSLFAAAYIINFCIYAPWAAKKTIFQLPKGLLECEYLVCETPIETWFKVYEWIRETISRILPFLLVAFFNVRILIAYRTRKKNLQNSLANNKSALSTQSILFHPENTLQEERRLFVLLFSIIIIFCVCTIPAAPLTIFVSDKHSGNLSFQIFRAIVNVIELTKFALNFYFYCLINPGIRSIFWQTVRCKQLTVPPLLKGNASVTWSVPNCL